MARRSSIPYTGVDPRGQIQTPYIIVGGCKSPTHVRTDRDVDGGTIVSKAGPICNVCKRNEAAGALGGAAEADGGDDEGDYEPPVRQRRRRRHHSPVDGAARRRRATLPGGPEETLHASTLAVATERANCVILNLAEQRAKEAKERADAKEARAKEDVANLVRCADEDAAAAARMARAAFAGPIEEAETVAAAAAAENAALSARMEAAKLAFGAGVLRLRELERRETEAKAKLVQEKIGEAADELSEDEVVEDHGRGVGVGNYADDAPPEQCWCCSEGVPPAQVDENLAGEAPSMAYCVPDGAGSPHLSCSECLTNQARVAAQAGATPALIAARGRLLCGKEGCKSLPFSAERLRGPAMADVAAAAADMRRVFREEVRRLEAQAAAAALAAIASTAAAQEAAEAAEAAADVRGRVAVELQRWQAELPVMAHCPNCANPVAGFDGCFWVLCDPGCGWRFCFFCLDVARGPRDPLFGSHVHAQECGEAHGSNDGFYGNEADYKAACDRHRAAGVAKFFGATPPPILEATVEALAEQLREAELVPAEILRAARAAV